MALEIPEISEVTEVCKLEVSEVKEKMDWFKYNPMFTGPNVKRRWWSSCIPKKSDLSGSQVVPPSAAGAPSAGAPSAGAPSAGAPSAGAPSAGAPSAEVVAEVLAGLVVEGDVADIPSVKVTLETSEKVVVSKYSVSGLLKQALDPFSGCKKNPLKKFLALHTRQEDNRPVINLPDPVNTQLAPEVVIVLESLDELESPKEKVPEDSQ